MTGASRGWLLWPGSEALHFSSFWHFFFSSKVVVAPRATGIRQPLSGSNFSLCSPFGGKWGLPGGPNPRVSGEEFKFQKTSARYSFQSVLWRVQRRPQQRSNGIPLLVAPTPGDLRLVVQKCFLQCLLGTQLSQKCDSQVSLRVRKFLPVGTFSAVRGGLHRTLASQAYTPAPLPTMENWSNRKWRHCRTRRVR